MLKDVRLLQIIFAVLLQFITSYWQCTQRSRLNNMIIPPKTKQIKKARQSQPPPHTHPYKKKSTKNNTHFTKNSMVKQENRSLNENVQSPEGAGLTNRLDELLKE